VRHLVAFVHLVEVVIGNGFLEVADLPARFSWVWREPWEGKFLQCGINGIAKEVLHEEMIEMKAFKKACGVAERVVS